MRAIRNHYDDGNYGAAAKRCFVTMDDTDSLPGAGRTSYSGPASAADVAHICFTEKNVITLTDDYLTLSI